MQLVDAILSSNSRVQSSGALFEQDQTSRHGFVGLLKNMASSLAGLTESQESISQIERSPQTSIKTLQDMRQRSREVEKAMQDLVDAISPENKQKIEKRVSDMVRFEQKTPAQAAAAIALERITGVNDQSEPQVLEAVVCAAARDMATTIRHANQINPSSATEAEIGSAVRAALSETHRGQLVLAFIDGVSAQLKENVDIDSMAKDSSESTDHQMSFLVEQVGQEFHLPDLMDLDHFATLDQAPLLRDFGHVPEASHGDQNLLFTDRDLLEIDALISDLFQSPVSHGDSKVREIPVEVQRKKILDSIAESALVAKAEASSTWAQHNSSAVFGVPLKQITIDAVRFVEHEAKLASRRQSSLADIQQTQRKCEAGKEAIFAATAMCKPETWVAIQNAVVNTINAGTQSPAQCVAEIVAAAVKPVLAYSDLPEVTTAKAAVAAVSVTVATQVAITLKPADSQSITDAVQSILRQSEQGQAVKGLIAGILAAGSPGNLS